MKPKLPSGQPMRVPSRLKTARTLCAAVAEEAGGGVAVDGLDEGVSLGPQGVDRVAHCFPFDGVEAVDGVFPADDTAILPEGLHRVCGHLRTPRGAKPKLGGP